MQDHGWSLKDLALKANLHERQVRRAWETYSKTALQGVARAFRMSVLELTQGFSLEANSTGSLQAALRWETYSTKEVENIHQATTVNNRSRRFIATDMGFIDLRHPKDWLAEKGHKSILRASFAIENKLSGVAARIFLIDPRMLMAVESAFDAFKAVLGLHVRHKLFTGFVDYRRVAAISNDKSLDFYVVEGRCLHRIDRKTSVSQVHINKDVIDEYADFFDEICALPEFIRINQDNFPRLRETVAMLVTNLVRHADEEDMSDASGLVVRTELSALDAERILAAPFVRIVGLAGKVPVPEAATMRMAQQGICVVRGADEEAASRMCRKFLMASDSLMYIDSCLHPEDYAGAVLSGHPT